jgi:hypothetical protein
MFKGFDMSTASKETATAVLSEKRPLTIVELAMWMSLPCFFIGSAICIYQPLAKNEDVERIVRAEALPDKTRENCSVLIDTQRHEGKCGTFGKYTVLEPVVS